MTKRPDVSKPDTNHDSSYAPDHPQSSKAHVPPPPKQSPGPKGPEVLGPGKRPMRPPRAGHTT